VYASPPTLFIKNMIEGKRPEIWGDGKQERDLVYIDDVVEALILAARSRLEGDTFNVGTGIPTSFLELASLINEILDQNLVPRFVPSRMPQYLRKTLAHTAKAEKLLGFTPHTSLREGLVKTISSFKELRATAQIPTVSQ